MRPIRHRTAGQARRGRASVVAIFMVLTFGRVGSPGEFLAFCWALRETHQNHYPEQPLWHYSPPLHSDFFTDDVTRVEPKLGIQPWLSAQAPEDSARRLFGPHAINEEKKEQEGATKKKCDSRSLENYLRSLGMVTC